MNMESSAKSELRILLIHYYFPPRGGAAVQRLLKFCKYLSRCGCKTYVLTSGAEYGVVDESLKSSIPEDTEVFTTFAPGKFKAMEGQFGRRNFFIDAFSHWVPLAVQKAKEIIREKGIDAIFTTSPPHSQQLIGLKLKKSLKIPWICDFRDPWTSDLRFMKHKSKLSRIFDLWAERRVLKAADYVIATTPSATNEFCRKLRFLDNCRKFKWIPNGYDPEDYPESVDSNPKKDKIVFTYIGSAGPLISDPTGFFKALRTVFDEKPELASKISVKFLGGLDPESRKLLKALKLDGTVEFLGFLPHDRAMKYMVESDILLLFEYSVDSSRQPTRVIPSKIFEYMGAERPVLALAIEGDTANIIRKYNLGTVVNPYDSEKICHAIEDCVVRFDSGRMESPPPAPKAFSRKEQSMELAELFRSLTTV